MANYLCRGAEVVVIERDGDLIGIGTLIPDKGGAGRIVRMSVAQNHRRQGHARRIIDELIKQARRREMSEVHVLTDTPWDSAVELYRACGFMELGDDGIDTHFRMKLTHIDERLHPRLELSHRAVGLGEKASNHHFELGAGLMRDRRDPGLHLPVVSQLGEVGAIAAVIAEDPHEPASTEAVVGIDGSRSGVPIPCVLSALARVLRGRFGLRSERIRAV